MVYNCVLVILLVKINPVLMNKLFKYFSTSFPCKVKISFYPNNYLSFTEIYITVIALRHVRQQTAVFRLSRVESKANVAKYFLQESKKETSPASYIRHSVEATGVSRTTVFKIRKEWLRNLGIPFRENLLKPQLLELARAHKPPPFYVIDQLFRQNGHEVLRLPLYHPEFNAIELIWSQLKRKQ